MKFYAVIAFAAVMASAMAASCVEEREAAQARVDAGMIGVSVPECEENGDWKPLQCHASAGMCRCVHPNGDELKAPSRRLGSCVCIIHRHQQLKKGLLGAKVPACEESGYYKKIQCHEARCSCADPLTGEMQGETRHISQLQDLKC